MIRNACFSSTPRYGLIFFGPPTHYVNDVSRPSEEFYVDMGPPTDTADHID